MNDPRSLSENVEKQKSEISYEVGHTIERRATDLRQAYVLALEHMHDTSITWQWCCEEAIAQLASVGIKTINNYQTITDWHRKFRRNNSFTVPSSKKQYTPRLLELYPEAKEFNL